MRSSTVLALGLSTLAMTAPIPVYSDVEDVGEKHVSLYGFIFKIPRLPVPKVIIEDGIVRDSSPAITSDRSSDAKPEPSTAVTGLVKTSSLPSPVPTTVLLAQGRQTSMPVIEDAEEEVEFVEVPDTVSPTSYARIEAGLIELYPSQEENAPCPHHARAGWRMSKYRYDAAVVGLVFVFLFVLLAVESWTAVCPCIRQAFLCEGSIRLEDDAKPCSKPSCWAEECPREKDTDVLRD